MAVNWVQTTTWGPLTNAGEVQNNYTRIQSNVRFSKHRVLQWLQERSFQPRPVNRDGAKRQ